MGASPVRIKVMEELHGTHTGISRRQYVWGPGMDADLEWKVKECSTCQSAPNLHVCLYILGNGHINHG